MFHKDSSVLLTQGILAFVSSIEYLIKQLINTLFQFRTMIGQTLAY